MKARAYCAHPSIRDHWGLRCMSRCPDQVVSLKRDHQCLSPQALNRRCFFGRLDCKIVLNPISGQVFDEGHDESGVVHSAEWHDDDWLDDGIREAWLLCIVRMVLKPMNITLFFYTICCESYGPGGLSRWSVAVTREDTIWSISTKTICNGLSLDILAFS
ncbi:hypothetical protein TNCV_4409451 [Trichonephila clavipes]|nr:hypothetical protein TNCV_4409451 [Trichonephila clavipes]